MGVSDLSLRGGWIGFVALGSLPDKVEPKREADGSREIASLQTGLGADHMSPVSLPSRG